MEPDIMAHSPDATGGTGEDSQQSVTLLNAMQLLPDTQISQSESPLSHDTPVVQVQLLSRPKEAIDADLTAGFAFAPRVKINPGQYNRRLPSKPINNGPEGGSNPCPLPGAIDTVRQNWFTSLPHANQPPSAPIQQDQRSPPQDRFEPVPPKQVLSPFAPPPRRPPFKDVQLPVSRLPAQEQPRGPIAAQVQRPIPQRQINRPQSPIAVDIQRQINQPQLIGTADARNQGSTLQSPISIDVQRHVNKPQSPRIVDVSRQAHTLQSPIFGGAPEKHRTSLPNDLSVSSPHPPRKIPEILSRRHPPVNRPLRDEHRTSSRYKTPSTQARTCSSPQSRSNVKKKRSAHRCHEKHSAYHGRASNGVETPCIRPSQASSPQNELKDKWRRKVSESMASCAGVLNQNFAHLEEEAKQHIKSIHYLERRIMTQQDKLSQFEADAVAKSNAIQDLEEERAHLMEQLEASKAELDGRSSRLAKVEDKCRTYKEYLNEAVAEQQKLYRATKEKCDGAINQMKQEEEKRKALQKRELVQAEASREHLRQIVKSTVDEFAHKEHEFNTTITQLNEKVQERDAEAVRERERATTILQQNESIASLQKTVSDFGGQIAQVVKVVGDLASQQSSRDDSSAKDMQAKLDEMMNHLHALGTRSQSPTVFAERLEETLEKSVASILGELKPIMDSQTETKDTLQQFTTDLEDKLADFWIGINEREEVLEDLVRQKQNEHSELALMLQNDLQAKEQELIEQSQQLLETEETLESYQDEVETMRQEIAELERDQAKSLEEADRLKELREKHNKLEEEASARIVLVLELQNKLEESKSTMTAQTEEHNKKTESLQKLMDDQLARAQTAQEQAVEQAQHQALQEMSKTKAVFENRLNHALEQRATLQKELDAAKARVSTLTKESDCRAETMAQLQMELEKANTRDTGMVEDSKQKDEAHRAALQEQAQRVGNLESELENWQKKFDNLTSSALAYDKAAFVVLTSLQKWTHKHTAIRELASEMAKNPGEDQQAVDSRFGYLAEMHVLQKAIIKYCSDQDQVVDALRRLRQDHNDDANFTEATRQMATALLDRARRVTLQIPAQMSPHHRPPSVNTEQERRRTAGPPKSIMKAVTYDISSGILPPTATQPLSQDDEEMSQRANSRKRLMGRDVLSEQSKNQPRGAFQGGIVQGGSILNRGPYNRPVARSNKGLDGTADAGDQGSSQESAASLEGHVDGHDVLGAPADNRKRREAFGQNQESSDKRLKRAKVAKSTVSTPRPSSPQGVGEFPPTAPRKRNQRGVLAQSASPIRASQLPRTGYRSQGAADGSSNGQSAFLRPPWIPLGPRSGYFSQNNSQDSLSLFPKRRQSEAGGEESQESITLSQDALGSGEASLPVVRRFSLMP